MANGNILHDWHAEILAIRAFNRWLVDECADLARQSLDETEWVRWKQRGRGEEQAEAKSAVYASKEHGHDTGDEGTLYAQEQPFEIRDDVSIHMYCSEAPCGDASMELTMAEQEDATPWSQALPTDGGMLGRGHFDQLGIVRRKPARPDAPPTLSKSCSDKLAMKQCTSLLSTLTSTLVHPGNVYIKTLILPESRHVRKATERAFSAKGRMAAVAGPNVQAQWQKTGYAFKPFEVKTTSKEFSFSKRSAPMAVPSNLSALHTPRTQEILINGVLQGRKQHDPRGASCASRRSMWRAVLDVAILAGIPALTQLLTAESYGHLKSTGRLASRHAVKQNVRNVALVGWKQNVADETFRLDQGLATIAMADPALERVDAR